MPTNSKSNNRNGINRRSMLARTARFGASAAAITPLLSALPSLADEPNVAQQRRMRLILVFSPDGTIVNEFWPDQEGKEFQFKRILAPLEPYKQNVLVMKGIDNKITGLGDRHMRGMSCLLTGTELAPGTIQGGSDRPAGWAGGISIDQEIKNHLQKDKSTETRFGSLEMGVLVPGRADPWTRWSYAGLNRPVAPISDPYLMFEKLYGQVEDQETLASVLDDLTMDIKSISKNASAVDRDKIDRHLTFVRDLEKELERSRNQVKSADPPAIPKGVSEENDNMPKLSRMQMDLLVDALASNNARVATFQFTKSVGNARMTWLGIKEGQHQLSHDPDLKKESQEKLTKINTWYTEQLVYLVEKLKATPEPQGDGSMFDHTIIVWGNELGKGNSHTLRDIPFVAIAGDRCSWETGRFLRFKKEPHNRLLMALAHELGHPHPTIWPAKILQRRSVGSGINLTTVARQHLSRAPETNFENCCFRRSE